MQQSLKSLKLNFNEINVISGLVLASLESPRKKVFCLNNLKYQVVVYFKGPLESALDIKHAIIDQIKQMTSFESEMLDQVIRVAGRDLIQFTWSSANELVAPLDLGFLLATEFDFDDERVVFSQDPRVFADWKNGVTKKRIKPFSIANPVWTHDISFWYKKESFCFENFVDAVRDVGRGLVRRLELLEEYEERSESFIRHALCLRLFYEPFDCALAWHQTTQLQHLLRHKIASFAGIVLR